MFMLDTQKFAFHFLFILNVKGKKGDSFSVVKTIQKLEMGSKSVRNLVTSFIEEHLFRIWRLFSHLGTKTKFFRNCRFLFFVCS